MHVTRGLSGELPVRLNCPPEMAHLVLHAVGRMMPEGSNHEAREERSDAPAEQRPG